MSFGCGEAGVCGELLCTYYCCVVMVRTRFSFIFKKIKEKKSSNKIWGTGLVHCRGQGQNLRGNSSKRRFEKCNLTSHRFSCGPRYVPEARRGRDDRLRRAKLRLVHSKTNLIRAKAAKFLVN